MSGERLQHEIATLEKQLKKWRARALALAVLLAAVLSLGLTQAPRILPGPHSGSLEAERFLLHDEHGRVRARMWVDGKDPVLEFYDERGRVVWSAPPEARIKPVR